MLPTSLETSPVRDEDVRREVLVVAAAALGVVLSDAQVDQFLRYLTLLVRWNARLGLTSLRAPNEIIRVHFVDALCVLTVPIPSEAHLIDVGSGAGLPGIPLQIVRPDLSVTLLEASTRKVAFLERVALDLGLVLRIELIRAEVAGQQRRLREAFDIATTRAVARLAVACELTLPFVRIGGRGVFLKGPRVSAELAGGARAAGILGGGVPDVIEVTLTDRRKRVVVSVPKISPTPAAFPRRPGVPKRNPLA